MGGGGGGLERTPIKRSWGEGVKIKKIIGRGVCQILKNMGRGGGGGANTKSLWKQTRLSHLPVIGFSGIKEKNMGYGVVFKKHIGYGVLKK